MKEPNDAVIIAERAREWGFTSTIGLIHDGDGLLKKLSPEELAAYDEVAKISTTGITNIFSPAKLSKPFQDESVEKGMSEWPCRAGSRDIYVCERCRVQWCSQQRVCKNGGVHGDSVASEGVLDVPLLDYTWEEFDRQFFTKKWCADTCTIQCVRLTSRMDENRFEQVKFGDYIPAK